MTIAPLTQLELAELDQVVKNGTGVATSLTAQGRLSHAGAVDSLLRAVRYLQARMGPPAPAKAEDTPPADPPAPDVGPKPKKLPVGGASGSG